MDKFSQAMISNEYMQRTCEIQGFTTVQEALALKREDGKFKLHFVRLASEAWQSRQAEVDQLKGLLEKDEYAHSLYYENLNLQTSIDEKDERIESALYVLKGLKAENDLWGCDQVEVQIEILEKALRGAND